jgi:lipopolysaccharide transport system permease protein
MESTDKFVTTEAPRDDRQGGGPPETSVVDSARQPTFVVQPSHGWRALGLKDLWLHRDLLSLFVWRDLKVRYKQAAFGAAWAVIQPFAMMVVFALFFGVLIKVSFGSVPYPIAAYTGLIPWTLFAQGVAAAAASLVASERLITKVYFPRLLVPVAAVGSFVVDFLIAFPLLLAMMAYYRIGLTARIAFLPLFALMAIGAALSVGIWLAALNVRYRDVIYAVPFLIQIWMYASPIVYPITIVPSQWQTLYALNPMVGVVEGFRWSLLATDAGPGWTTLVSACVVLVVLLSGIAYFKRVERSFADII